METGYCKRCEEMVLHEVTEEPWGDRMFFECGVCYLLTEKTYAEWIDRKELN